MKICRLMGTSADLDHRGQAAPVGAQPAVGPESGAVAGGAVRTDRDTVGRQAGLEQPPAVGALQVHMVLVRAGNRVDERLRGAPQTGPQPGGDIPVGLKAAQGDARPDGRHQVARAAAEVPDHGLRGPGGDAQGGAPPSGVDCRGHLLPGVAQQHRDTVGGKDGQTQAGGPGDQAVGLYSTGRARGGEHIGPGDRADQIPVDLMIFHQSVRVRPHSAAEAAEILRHTLRLVAAGGPKVQRVPRRGGDAPHPGGKAVWKAGLLHGGAGIKKDAMALIPRDLHGRPSFAPDRCDCGDVVIFYCIPKSCGWQPVTREKCRELLQKVKAFVPNGRGSGRGCGPVPRPSQRYYLFPTRAALPLVHHDISEN